MKAIIWTIVGVLLISLVFVFKENIFAPRTTAFNLLPIKNSQLVKEKILPAKVADKKSEVSLLAVGDIMLSRSVEQMMIAKNDWQWPFDLIATTTNQADISFANLESPLTPGRIIKTGEFAFRADPKSVAGLNLAGFDVVSLANNHTPNFGQDGLSSTFKTLDDNNITYVGAGLNDLEARQPIIITKQGLKFGFLAYNDPSVVPVSYQASDKRAGTAFMDIDNLKEDIAKLRPQVDWLIVTMHAGDEYQARPNKQQKDFAHSAIDAGADLIIGHHPHVVQTMEEYKGKYIFYSLGNFVFDQLWSEDTRRGLMVKFIFTKDTIKTPEFIPVYINKSFQPEVAKGDLAEKILNRLK